MKFFLLLSISSLIMSNLNASVGPKKPNDKVIYGNDDRQEVAEYPNELFRNKAKSVAGMVAKTELGLANGIYVFDDYMTMDNMTILCPGERFGGQVMLPSCTGFLVAPDTLVTAGHCITDQKACDENVWVFDYVKDTYAIGSDDVYNCKEIVGQKLNTGLHGLFATKDYAVIKLDRPVKDRSPLQYRKNGHIKKNEEVLVIGHPAGLPMKIADNAKVRHTTLNTFRADLDTYGGNSGSPVFNKNTGLVEGILVQGAEDYERIPYANPNEPWHKECIRSIVRTKVDGRKTKEKIFKITHVKEL